MGYGQGAWAAKRIDVLRRGAEQHFNLSTRPHSVRPDEVERLLNGTDNPKVLVVWNYRAHFWRFGNFPDKSYGPPDQRGLRRLRLPGEPKTSNSKGKQGLGIYNSVRSNVAMMRWAREQWGYKIVLFDGQGAGCQSPSTRKGRRQHLAGITDVDSGTGCTCDPETLHLYAEPIDAIFRHYYCPGLRQLVAPVPLVIVPLGVHWKHRSGSVARWNNSASVLPSSGRQQAFTFLGSMTDAARASMAEFLRRLSAEPGVSCGRANVAAWGARGDVKPGAKPGINECATGDISYQQILLRSVLCPAPRGVKMESFRLTESIEAGCLPIVDDGGLHHHNEFPGINEHVIVTSRDWKVVKRGESSTGEDLVEHVATLLRNKTDLDQRQRELLLWYARHRAWFKRKVTTTLREALGVTTNPPGIAGTVTGTVNQSFVRDADCMPSNPECDDLIDKDGMLCRRNDTLGTVLHEHCPQSCATRCLKARTS